MIFLSKDEPWSNKHIHDKRFCKTNNSKVKALNFTFGLKPHAEVPSHISLPKEIEKSISIRNLPTKDKEGLMVAASKCIGSSKNLFQ